MNPTRFPQLNQYTLAQLVDAFKIFAKVYPHDRQAIAYFIGMVDPHAGQVAKLCNLKFSKIFEMLTSRINENTIFCLIQSEHTAEKLAKILSHKK